MEEDIKKEVQEELIKEEKKMSLVDVLKLIAPGTQLRQAIEEIVSGRMGTLIVIDNNLVQGIIEKGFKVNCRLTHQRLFELSKMDGAIIISSDMKKILYANTLLVPDRGIYTSETGTRHKSAERTAKQANTIVIAVSERRRKVTVYSGNLRYSLKITSDILNHATTTLQTLEKQKELLDELKLKLNILEINNLVSIRDVCSIIQRIEIIIKISEIIKRDILELGKEGSIVNMRLKELIKDIDKNELLILRDYVKDSKRIKQALSELSFESLLDIEILSRMLFEENIEENIQPKGYRILEKTLLSEKDRKSLISQFRNLFSIIEADSNKIFEVLKDTEKTKKLIEDLKRIREQISMEKDI